MEREFPGPRPVSGPFSDHRAGARVIHLADARTKLPEGVTPAEWALERARTQNPRIRTFLVCIRLLEGAHDSNYAILHCSPQRLQEIWVQVGRVAQLIRGDLAASLEPPSRIPALEMARRRAQLAARALTNTTLAELSGFPETLAAEQMLDARKVLCVSIGKIHAFLQDTFCQVMAADPRSHHGPDYFLSRRFPRDIEDAEWLHTSVERLSEYLDELGSARYPHLERLRTMLQREQTIPNGPLWDEVRELLEILERELTPQLKEALAQRGIRFDEMEALDRYAFEIPAACRLLKELDRAARQVTDEILTRARRDPGRWPDRVEELVAAHAIFASRIAILLRDLDRSFRDLLAFVPLWLESIGLRRALLLTRHLEE
ncbi:MAG: hypothetical protein R3325_07275 [Thermoanaerobaculia bacterium]|nr:hypothetical protein [Thermoanaerobaculia bacterium]